MYKAGLFSNPLIYVFYDAIYASDNISQLAHIAGGICGAIFGLYFMGYHKEPI